MGQILFFFFKPESSTLPVLQLDILWWLGIMQMQNELPHSISYKIACLPNEDSDQSAHMYSALWRP